MASYNFFSVYTHAIIKSQINCAVSAQLISAFVFTTRLVQSPYFFNLIFLYAVAWLGCTLHVTWLYATCNVQPSQATANPVDGKACSSTKGGLLRYIPNTYSIHKVSSLKFAYFQGKLSRYITSPSEKTRPESWPGDYMGKATPVWRLSSSHRCHQM